MVLFLHEQKIFQLNEKVNFHVFVVIGLALLHFANETDADDDISPKFNTIINNFSFFHPWLHNCDIFNSLSHDKFNSNFSLSK